MLPQRGPGGRLGGKVDGWTDATRRAVVLVSFQSTMLFCLFVLYHSETSTNVRCRTQWRFIYKGSLLLSWHGQWALLNAALWCMIFCLLRSCDVVFCSFRRRRFLASQRQGYACFQRVQWENRRHQLKLTLCNKSLF